MIAAIDHATGAGVAGDVINLSLITGAMESMDTAVQGAGAAGLLVAIAAGNTSTEQLFARSCKWAWNLYCGCYRSQ